MLKNTDLYYVHLFNDFSGSPRVIRDAIEAGVCDPNNTFVLTSKHKGFLDGVRANRISCFYGRSQNKLIQLFYFLVSQLFLFLQLSYYLIKSALRKQQSIVVVNTMLPFGAGLAAKLFATKCIYYIHETHIKPNILKAFLRFFIQHCATDLIFVSKYLQRTESFNKQSQSVIYNGLRSDFLLVDRVDEDLKFNSKELFFAGSLKAYKGIEQLLKLAELLPEFTIVAALNCEEIALTNFTKGRTIPSNVSLFARPDNIQQYFERSFVVLNLSLPDGWIETFGLSLIEGMAYGTPVVSPQVGGPTEFVNDKNGLLVDANELEKISCFIRYLNSSQSIWCTYSIAAFNTSQHFTNETFSKNYTHYFKQFDLFEN